MMKASSRVALIVLAGLVLLFGGLAQAAPDSAASNKSDSAAKGADTAKPRRHDARRVGSGKAAQKSDKKDAAAKADEAKIDKNDGEVPGSAQMPPAVADANAQLPADTPTAAAASQMTNRANDNVHAAAGNAGAENPESQVVAPDQINDIDRAAQENAPAQTAVIAATEAQPRPAPVMASSQQGSAWDQSSLIGKIFIGVGTLLTLASAARMFMA
ncbi:MAG TPA: hypothetical protein VNK51_13685 [Bradyrhizobium sp.]|nr:hypothetical protein [Bradyrhizobium sp.]